MDARGGGRKARADSMSAGRAFLIFIFALHFTGCGDARGRALRTMKRFKQDQLRREVALFYKDVFAQHQKMVVTLDSKYWSQAFADLRPERITAYPDGFAFRLESNGDAESGLYIVPLGMDLEPKPTPWASYEKLNEGIYWYSFKP